MAYKWRCLSLGRPGRRRSPPEGRTTRRPERRPRPAPPDGNIKPPAPLLEGKPNWRAAGATGARRVAGAPAARTSNSSGLSGGRNRSLANANPPHDIALAAARFRRSPPATVATYRPSRNAELPTDARAPSRLGILGIPIDPIDPFDWPAGRRGLSAWPKVGAQSETSSPLAGATVARDGNEIGSPARPPASGRRDHWRAPPAQAHRWRLARPAQSD